MTEIEMIHVSSSNLRSVGYDNQTQTLRIEFHGGGTYDYYDVPLHVFSGLMNAGSKGHYHHAYIKDRYRYSRVA